MYASTYQQPSFTYADQRGTSFSQGPPVFNARMFKVYGAILAILAAATLSLGIANVVMTRQAYCDPWMDDEPTYCSNTKEPYIWTWVASGIWAGAPIFIAGLFSMSLSADPSRWTRLFALFIFLSAIVFSPAMIILSSIEVWRGGASKWNFYKMDSDLMEGNIMVEESPYQAKFALPLVIAILGGIMFLMTGLITLTLCCCMQSLGLMLNAGPSTTVQQIYQPSPAVVSTKEVYYPPRAQITSQVDYQPTTGPYMATRYNNVLDPNNPGSMFGNFASKAFSPGGGSATNFYDGGNAVYRR
jgi:hypothetical protein